MLKKLIYTAPAAETLVVGFEGMICGSPDEFVEGGAGDYSGNIFDNGSF